MRGGLCWLWLRRVLVGVVCVAAAVGAVWGLYAGFRYWRVERAIGRFEAGPSQARADVLVAVIDSSAPTAKQGERALRLLLTPTVITRQSYPLGSCPVISVELPLAVRFHMVNIGGDERLLCDGAPSGSHAVRSRDVTRGSPGRLTVYPAPPRTGVYSVELRQEYRVSVSERHHQWSWRPFGGPFPRCLLPRRRTIRRFMSSEEWDYACSITSGTEVVVVEAEEAEKVTLVSSAGLDEGMRAAFGDGTTTGRGRGPPGLSYTKSQGTMHIRYENIPAAVGFEPVLCLEDGREIASAGRASRRLRARAGASGVFIVSPWVLVSEESGPFRGVLELRADPEAAYEDPAIKAIWGRALRFPITFSAYRAVAPSP